MEQILKILHDFLYSPEQQHLAYSIIDAIVYLFFLVAVLYLLLFSLKALSKRHNEYTAAKKKYRFGIIFTARGSDDLIKKSVDKFLEQKYPRDKYDIIVVGVGLKPETERVLQSTSAVVLTSDNLRQTKTDSIKKAMNYIEEERLGFDIIVILDADNEVDDNYLEKLNDAFYSGCSIVQTHCRAKRCTTSISVLDAVSEEINNSIFRKGHTRFGLSSGLNGSGMALEYNILKKFFTQRDVENLDKQLERFLLKREYYIEYLNDIYTYNEKVAQREQYYKQRRQWLSAQFYNLLHGIWGCPKAAIEGNWDYCNKLLQWAMPPRIVLFGLIILIAVGLTILGSTWAIKWWVLLVAVILVFVFSVPDYLFNGKLLKALFGLPLIFGMMVINSIIGLFKHHN